MKPTVAIVGVGLIGGSLGMALRRRGYRVIGVARKTTTLRDAKRLGAIDEGSQDFSAVGAADIVIVCTPVALIVPTIQRFQPFLKPNAIVSDAGSVKGAILRRLEPLIRRKKLNFVGAHPLTGSHKTGVKAARRDLFFGSTVVLSARGNARLGPIAALWKATGARVLKLSVDRHDEVVALISHLPHVLAHALVHSVLRRKDQSVVKRLMAGSFRDMTRVAGSDPEQWTQIFEANSKNVRRSIAIFRRELARLEKQIAKPGLKKILRQSQAYRLPLFHGI